MTLDLIKAVVLGVVEGLTEFIPVSSTGHLLLVQRFFGFADEDFGKTFAILIQFGAILALLSIYFTRLWRIAIGFFIDPAARRFVFSILLAFLPAAVVGALAHDFIHFTPDHHFGFEAAAWYWHFVDVVWLFLFICVYWWGGAGAEVAG